MVQGAGHCGLEYRHRRRGVGPGTRLLIGTGTVLILSILAFGGTSGGGAEDWPGGHGARGDGGGYPTPDEIVSHLQAVPSPGMIVERLLTVNRAVPRIASMEFEARLRVRRPLSAPPDCAFEGVVTLGPHSRSATVRRLTPRLLCFIANRAIIGRLFSGNEPFEALLSRFDFQVLGGKVVDGDRYYLVQGRARDAGTDPRAMIGWVDYDRGVVSDATMDYAARTLEVAQTYTSVDGVWYLTSQYVAIPSLGATLEIAYSKITLASRGPGGTRGAR